MARNDGSSYLLKVTGNGRFPSRSCYHRFTHDYRTMKSETNVTSQTHWKTLNGNKWKFDLNMVCLANQSGLPICTKYSPSVNILVSENLELISIRIIVAFIIRRLIECCSSDYDLRNERKQRKEKKKKSPPLEEVHKRGGGGRMRHNNAYKSTKTCEHSCTVDEHVGQKSDFQEGANVDDTTSIIKDDIMKTSMADTTQTNMDATTQTNVDDTAQTSVDDTTQTNMDATTQTNLDDTTQTNMDDTTQTNMDATTQTNIDDATQRPVDDIIDSSSLIYLSLNSSEAERIRLKNISLRGMLMEDPWSPSEWLGIHFKKNRLHTKFMSPQATSVLSYSLSNVNIECLKYELLRIKTFRMSEIGENMQSWVLEIASTGFYLSGKGGEVTCFSCSRRHYKLLAGTSLSDAHEPDCRWHEANKPLSCFTQGLSSKDLNAFEAALASSFGPQSASSLASADIAHDGVPSASSATVGRDSVDALRMDGAYSALATECLHESRISQEESLESSHKMLTSATEEEPYDLDSGRLFDAQGGLSSGSTVADRGGAAALYWDLSGASYPQFASREARRETFKYWDPNHMQKPDDLVALGFFFSGYSDCARCFYCGLGLKYWRANDDAAYQHARYRPFCLYNRLVKGQEFIDHVQQKINQQGTTASPAATVADSDSHLLRIKAAVTAVTKGWTNEDIIKAVKNVMQGKQTDAAIIAYADILPHLENFKFETRHDGQPASSQQGQSDTLTSTTSLHGSLSSYESRILASRAAVEALQHGWDQKDVLSVIRNLILGSNSKLPGLEYSMLEPHLQKMKAEKQEDKEYAALCSHEPTASSDGQMSGIKIPEGPKPTTQIEPLGDLEKIRLAEEEHDLLRAKMYCMVCKVNRIGCIFLPCGHVVACQECGERATACCLCSKHIIALANIYLS